MELLPIIFWIVVAFFIVKNAISKNQKGSVDWGNVGAHIQNAQKVMKESSGNNTAYGETTTAYHKVPSRDRASIKGTKEHLAQIQQRLQEKMDNASKTQTAAWGSNTKKEWVSSNTSSSTPSHQRNHIHSDNNYSSSNYSIKDYFKNDSVPVDEALKSCQPAVNKGWFDKGDRGQTVDRG